jgi:hypothetical protein
MSDTRQGREWLIERFDRIDQDNKDIKTELMEVHSTVMRHSAYWNVVKYLAGSGGAIAAFLSFVGYDKKH